MDSLPVAKKVFSSKLSEEIYTESLQNSFFGTNNKQSSQTKSINFPPKPKIRFLIRKDHKEKCKYDEDLTEKSNSVTTNHLLKDILNISKPSDEQFQVELV